MSVLLDACGIPFDPRPLIARWKQGDSDAIRLLWEHLHHQGELGSASFAAVPDLVDLLGALDQPDWNVYALVATIEEVRSLKGEMPPVALASAYSTAWTSVLPFALRDLAGASEDKLVLSLIAVIAHAKGQHTLGALALCTEDERQEMLG
ncbi:hypothetical protein [Novosphingobium sp. EMRT-2]|uniref:hypothetical protein n=1 Tax=Novosphingobium sp. EMRT-2 TaxID=2571749 RepID=UPI0010BDD3D1|nr:hypothetical protein [Novosphingobium sp. EMRT-2]QCI93763.1 hypothetical protein FA702_09435 [Novosphingobium sp. EMRT-2]